MGRYAQASRRGRPTRIGPAPVSGLTLQVGDFFVVTFNAVPGTWTLEWELEWGVGGYQFSETGTFTLASGGGETSVEPGAMDTAHVRARVIVAGAPHDWSAWVNYIT